jgi:hypothetical protein
MSARAGPEQEALATRLRPYFALQLALAETVSARSGGPLRETITSLTNLHRRFGLESDGESPESEIWSRYVERVSALRTSEERLDCTMAAFKQRPREQIPAHREIFGCFSFEPPTQAGAVRLHFSNRDSDGGLGPLAKAKAPRRLAELRRMFARIRDAYPGARSARGGSWLYNVEAYRRLFPPEYVASRSLPARVRLNGSSSWGQFLDHRERVKPNLRDTFLRNLELLDETAPWTAFPLRALSTTAPIEVFHRFYGLGR